MIQHLRLGFVIAAIATAILVMSPPSGALAGGTLTVDSETDAVDANPGDGMCATAENECTVRAAIQEANALTGAQTISIPAGTFTLSIPGTNEENAATGDLDINEGVTIAGADIDDTFIDGANLDRVFHVRSGIVEIRDLTIQRGLSEDLQTGGGAGVYNESTLNLLRTQVILNWSVISGGGIANRKTMSIAQSWIDSNHTEENGAGIWSDGPLTIVDSLISNNFAEGFLGGVEQSGSELTMTNSTITGNTGDIVGGGLQVTFGGIGDIVNSTIVNNDGSDRGGLTTNGNSTLTISNSIVANNTGANCFVDATLTDSGHNLSSDDSCGFTGNGGLDNTNPLIAALEANGGFTKTHALYTGSPAIDAADDTLCPNQDQRGTARPQGAHCDIGAYEATGTEPTPPPGQVVAWGDNNCSGSVEPVDALLALRHDAGLSANTGSCPDMGAQIDATIAALRLWGDVDCSDAVDPVDALKLLRSDAGLSVSQNTGCPDIGSDVTIVET